MKVLGIKVHGELDHCGHCGKLIKGVPRWGVGCKELPIMLYGRPVVDDVVRDIIASGGMVIVPMCSPACRGKYLAAAAENEGGTNAYRRANDTVKYV